MTDAPADTADPTDGLPPTPPTRGRRRGAGRRRRPRRPAATCAPPWAWACCWPGWSSAPWSSTPARSWPSSSSRSPTAPGRCAARSPPAAWSCPLVPLLLGAVGMLVSAYLRGAEALVVTFGLTIVGSARLAGGRRPGRCGPRPQRLGARRVLPDLPRRVRLDDARGARRRPPADRRLHPRHRVLGHRRVCRRRHVRAAPDGAVAQPQEVLGGLRRLGRSPAPPSGRSRCRCCSAACGGRAPSSASPRRREPRPWATSSSRASSATSASRTWARCCPGTAA